MSASHISPRSDRDTIVSPGRLVNFGEALFGVGVVSVFAGANAFVRWVTTCNGWILSFLVAKPLIDLTWRWEFVNIFNQRVNPQAIVAILVAVLNGIVLVSSWRSPHHSRRMLFFLGFAVLSVIVTPTSWGMNELLRLFSGVSFFFTAGFVLGEKKKFDRFALLLLAVLCVPLSLSLLQVAGILPFEYWDWLDGQNVGRASGTYQHPLEIVFFLVYAVPLALYRWENTEKGGAERVFLAVFFVLAFLGLAFTFHRAGWIAICIELGVWFASKKHLKRILFGAVGIAVLAIAFSDRVSLLYEPSQVLPSQSDLESGDFMRGRGANWIAFLTSYANGGPVRWIIGKGGSLAEVSLPGIVEFAETEPHNDFIRILHAYGLIGLCLYLSLLTAFFREGFRLWKSQNAFASSVGRILVCCIAGILLLSLTAEPMRYPTGGWYLFALGSIVMFWERGSNEHAGSKEEVRLARTIQQ